MIHDAMLDAELFTLAFLAAPTIAFAPPQGAPAMPLAYCDAFGRSVVSPGDLDGDGIDDLLVSAPWQSRAGEAHLGAVFAFSGKDGAELYRVWGCGTGGRADEESGRLAATGDIDRDGVGDFLVTTEAGVELRSGAAGALVRMHEAIGVRPGKRERVAGLGDVDGDEVPDYAIAEPGWESYRGRVRLVSGKTGELVRECTGDKAGDWYGFALSGGMDVNGDGVPDLLVGAPRGNVAEHSSSVRMGCARILSGADGAVLVSVEASRASDCFGETVAFVGDWNGDGCADFAVGAPGCQWPQACPTGRPGFVQVFSGGDGELLRTIDGPAGERGSCAYDAEFGSTLAAAGDVDADGRPDLIVGARRENVLGGSARVISGRSGETLHERIGLPFGDQGHLVGSLGDVDGDGCDDFFHVALNDTAGAISTGQVLCVSGKEGTELRRLTSPLRPPRK